MTKKEYILAVIDSVPNREMWRGIKAMINNNQLDDKAINSLVIVFKKVVKDFLNKKKQEETVERFNKQKEDQTKQDKENLRHLDDMLNNI